MAETPDQIKRHVANLREFETKFGEFVTALNHEIVAGEKRWNGEEKARRKRELSGLAAKADRAMKVSGVNPYVLLNPPVIGGGVRSADLPSQIFDFYHVSDNDDGLTFQRKILERIPAQLAGLELRLEEAEAADEGPTSRVTGPRRWRRKKPPKEMEPWPKHKRPWHENPWLVAIGSGIVVGIVVLLLTHS
jgi:hypothetical protein